MDSTIAPESAPAPHVDAAEPEPSVVGLVGPAFAMYGFAGCTDRNPDLCACATDEDVECTVCGEVIEPGVLTYARQEGVPWMDPDDPEQDWTTLWWHASCDMRSNPTGDPALAAELAAKREAETAAAAAAVEIARAAEPVNPL